MEWDKASPPDHPAVKVSGVESHPTSTNMQWGPRWNDQRIIQWWMEGGGGGLRGLGVGRKEKTILLCWVVEIFPLQDTKKIYVCLYLLHGETKGKVIGRADSQFCCGSWLEDRGEANADENKKCGLFYLFCSIKEFVLFMKNSMFKVSLFWVQIEFNWVSSIN
jgi:hypothetical protein